jgi:hypothetical protein
MTIKGLQTEALAVLNRFMVRIEHHPRKLQEQWQLLFSSRKQEEGKDR